MVAVVDLLRACFDPETGHGYTLCRVHMNSCDFSLGNYAHADTPGDTALKDFRVDRDEQALLPFLIAAQRIAGSTIQLLVSPWSPPAWMKTNGQMNGGGRLRPECRSAWAQPRLDEIPLTLGVASGSPRADSVVLWTRLRATGLFGIGFEKGDAHAR